METNYCEVRGSSSSVVGDTLIARASEHSKKIVMFRNIQASMGWKLNIDCSPILVFKGLY